MGSRLAPLSKLNLLAHEIRMAIKHQQHGKRSAPDMESPMAIFRWAAMGLLLTLTACNAVPVVIDPPEPPNVSQCLLGPTPDVPEPPLFAWELPVYLVEVLGILTEERTLRQGEHDCIGGMQAEGVVK